MNNHEKKNVGLRFLGWFCPPILYEQIEGDLLQRYYHDLKSHGKQRANWKLFWNACKFFRPGIIFRNKFSSDLNIADMLFTHLRFSVRVFLRDKFFSLLNILGLALGIAVGIILLLMLQSDLNYDKHYSRQQNIYRLAVHYKIPGTDEDIGRSARELGPILTSAYPEIQSLTRVRTFEEKLVTSGGGADAIAFYEHRVVQTDSAYLRVFDHKFIQGDERTCLNDIHSVVVTASTSDKYFGSIDALNKTINIDGKDWTVTGVIEDLPDNTHLKFDFLLSGLPEQREDWDNTMENGKPISLVFWNPDVELFMLMPEGYRAESFPLKFAPIYKNYFKQSGDQLTGSYIPFLQPLAEIHFQSEVSDPHIHGNWTYLYALTGIGAMIILLAIINYMNLSTAKASARATEIGVRKVIGSGRLSLVISFFCESILLSIVSLILAIGIVIFTIEATSFNVLIGKDLSLDFLRNPLLWSGSVVIALGIGFISGLYPALYLPSIPSVVALKGRFKNSTANHRLRRVLVVIQFAISISVVACTLLMRDQINFLRGKDLGFNKENMIVIPVQDSAVHGRLPLIRNELQSDRRILAMTSSGSVMGLGIGGNVMFGEGPEGMVQRGSILGHFVGDDYIKTMGITLLKGRDFQPGKGVDEDGMYIANEAAVKAMEWGDDALGKKVTFWEGMNPGTVIGLVKDFNASSLHYAQEPMFIVKGHWQKGYFQVRVSGEDLPGTIEKIKQVWSKHDADHPFEYFFLDQRFNEQYKADVIQNTLLSILAYICISISLLGAFGLSAFAASQRTKEVGVRKVLGADLADILILLTRDILLLVVVAAVLVAPVSYWVVMRWLQNFSYQGPLSFWQYPAIILMAIIVVFFTIAFQALRAAKSNPVDALKSE
jgi:putative ABC transport system permease protein